MRRIQTNSLPDDWFQQVSNFNVDKSSLSKNNKIIANTIINYIKQDKKNSLINPLARQLICYIVFKTPFLTAYDDLPEKLINDALAELKGQKGINFTKKLHSLFIEFIIYKKLKSYGFTWNNTNRTSGSCDLVMQKDNNNYNFEVKFKESKDILQSRLLGCIDGMSLLDEYSFFRGKTFEIHIISKKVTDKIQNEILEEVRSFVEQKEDVYEGKHIDIFEIGKLTERTRDIEKVSAYNKSLKISKDLVDVDSIYELILDIFNNDGGHLTKLAKKSKSTEDFYGCLMWSIPFHNDISCENMKIAFEKLKLDFGLYVFAGGIAKNNCDFFVPSVESN